MCEPWSPRLDDRHCRMTQLRPSWQRPCHPGSAVAGAWWTSLWCCGQRRSEAAALVWSEIERWDDGSGRLLIEGSTTDQTGEAEVVFLTRRAMAALDELRQLRGDASPSVFEMTAKTIKLSG